jgi:signal transduction histidine kinase
MNKSLSILHVEDTPDDSDVVRRLLEKEWGECEFVRVETLPQFQEAVKDRTFDIILSDYRLPGFTGLEALEIARTVRPDIPFIFISGMMGEEKAIESLRNGATDYVLKDRLKHLVPAVRRALLEAREHLLNRKLQQRLLEASRLQAVSTLSTGISHDFNNILTIILGHSALLKIEHEKTERIFEISDTISSAARRAADIIQQLMAFAQKSEGNAVITDINRRIREIINQVRGTLPDEIAILFEPAKDLPHILMDRSQLETILINLVANALDSMPEGGTIHIATSLVPMLEVTHSPPNNEVDSYICLRVTDSGKGMDEVTRQHIFEPFYTTKERGRATGMGLPAVYGLMQALNGWIDVISEPGQGTMMTLFFPVVRDPVAKAATQSQLLRLPRAGRAAILVIEDETDVSLFLEAILTSGGYKVLVASDSIEALSLFKTNQSEIQLVLSDIGLPKVDGITICKELKVLKPLVKIILCSGYSSKDFKERIDELGVDAFFPKPYDPQSLVESVKRILERS